MIEELRVGQTQTEKDISVALELIQRKLNELIRRLNELEDENQ